MTQPPFPTPPGSPDPAAQPSSGYPQPGAAPQPGYPGAPQAGYPGAPAPVPPKKSNVGKIILIVLAVLALLCVGGGTLVYFAAKDEVKDVVDASKTRLVAPETLAGRPKITDPQIQAAADEMVASMKASVPDATSTIGGFYGDPAKKDMVMIAGASGLIPDPAKELDDAISELGSSGGLTTSNFTAVDAGPLGGNAKCGDAEASGIKLGVCVWADRGSLGVVGVYFKTAEEAKADFLKIRSEVEQRS
ncbi:hypothetical protein [Micromonospora sp. NPDC049679]|uniref:hypothetical protein n=1 Tax=Micromonospora sp. NPDC049679 TaxID=3155920 RepID=UPI0033DCC29D